MKMMETADKAVFGRSGGVLAVVLDHTQYFFPVMTSSFFNVIRVVYFSFFLQIFFFVPGMLSDRQKVKVSDNVEKSGFMRIEIHKIKKYAVSLLIPYFLWALIYTGSFSLKFFQGVLFGSCVSLMNAGTNSIIWFFPVMFLSRIIYDLLLEVLKNIKVQSLALTIEVALIVCLSFISDRLSKQFESGLWFGFNVSLMGVALMITGYLLNSIIGKSRNIKSIYKCVLFIGLLLLDLRIIYYNMPTIHNIDGTYYYDYTVWMARGFFGRSPILFLLESILSCYLLIQISGLFTSSKLLTYLGRHTMVIMMWHGIIFTLMSEVNNIYFHIGEMNLLWLLVMQMICTAIMTPICFLSDRYFPGLEGKAVKKAYTAQNSCSIN